MLILDLKPQSWPEPEPVPLPEPAFEQEPGPTPSTLASVVHQKPQWSPNFCPPLTLPDNL